MTQRRIAVGVIGCGYWAQRHLRAWRDLHESGVDLVAVCDTDASKAQAAGERFMVAERSTDARSLIRSGRLDLVDIATRMETHLDLVETALASKLPTVVQKPMAPNWRDCLAIAEAARRNKTFLAVHENFRFQPAMAGIAETLAAGTIGPPSWARISYRTGADVYANQPYFLHEPRLVTLDLGIHMLDLARVFLGEVQHLSCETQRRNPNVRAEDTATMLLRHANGAVSVVECTYESRGPAAASPEVLVEIEGPRGTLTAQPGGREISVTVNGTITRHQLTVDDVAQASVQATCAHVLHALRAGTQAATDVNDNLKTYALVEAAYEAAASGLRVRPSL